LIFYFFNFISLLGSIPSSSAASQVVPVKIKNTPELCSVEIFIFSFSSFYSYTLVASEN